MSDEVPLRQHFEALLEETDKRYNQRFEAQEKAVSAAEANSEKWRNNANEWRESMLDRERQFFSKSMGYVVALLSVLALILSIAEKIFM